MPSRQQKSAKKSSERYLMFGSNHILITLKWNHGHCPTRENVCRWFLNRCKQLLRPTKLTNRVSWNMLEMEFKISKLVKTIVFRCIKFAQERHLWPKTEKVNIINEFRIFNSLGTKFQLKLTILIFFYKICPKRVFLVQNRNSEHHIFSA